MDKIKIIMAQFKPRNVNDWDARTLEICQKNKLFQFKFAYKIKQVGYWEPDDINWPGSNPICELDLKIINVL